MSNTKQTGDVNILNFNNLSDTLERTNRLSRDLKSLMTSVGGKLHFIMSTEGKISDVWIADRNGNSVATETHMKALGGIRREIAARVKETEQVTTDHFKISMVEKLVLHRSTKIMKPRPEVNGRISENLRLVFNTKENLELIAQWDDETTEKRQLKEYVESQGKIILQILTEEQEHLVSKGAKSLDNFIDEKLNEWHVIEWMYNRFTQKGSVKAEMCEANDFLFPKNCASGIYLKQGEIENSDMVDRHGIVTENNADLFAIAIQMRSVIKDPDGKDAIRKVKEYLDGVKWNLVPQMSFDEMRMRFKDANYKASDLKLPEGEAGHVMKTWVSRMNRLNMDWNQYYRFSMNQNVDKDQFWKYYVDETEFAKWDFTAERGMRYYLTQIDGSDLFIDDELFRSNCIGYCIAGFGNYDRIENADTISQTTPFVTPTANERKAALKTKEDDYKDALTKFRKDKTAADAMPEGTDLEKAAKLAAQRALVPPDKIKPSLARIPVFTTPSTGAPFVVTRNLGHNDEDQVGDYLQILNFNPDNPPIINETQRDGPIHRLFRAVSTSSSKHIVSGTVLAPLSPEVDKILLEISNKSEFGKQLAPRMRDWLKSSFTGAPVLMDIAAQSMFESLMSRDYLVPDVV